MQRASNTHPARVDSANVGARIVRRVRLSAKPVPERLFDGSPEAWQRRDDRQRELWDALLSGWGQLGLCGCHGRHGQIAPGASEHNCVRLSARAVSSIVSDLLSLRHAREVWEERLLDAQGLHRDASGQIDRGREALGEDYYQQKRKRREVYLNALYETEKELAEELEKRQNREPPRDQPPGDLLSMIKALRARTLEGSPAPPLPAHATGEVWARPYVWRIATVFLRSGVSRNRTAKELYSGLRLTVGEIVQLRMIHRWLRPQELRRQRERLARENMGTPRSVVAELASVEGLLELGAPGVGTGSRPAHLGSTLRQPPDSCKGL